MVTSRSKPTGRGRTGEVRQRILDAATSEFSARGFAGGRVDRIAVRARVNKRMIYHYFGHKRGLRQAVLERCLAVSAPGELLERSLHPAAARLLLWTLLEDGEQGPPPEAVAALRQSGGRLLRNLVDALSMPRRSATPAHKPRIRLKPKPRGR